MFEIYRAYYAYRQSIIAWAEQVGYQPSDIVWVFPWQTETSFAEAKVVVSFGAPLVIDGFIAVYSSEHLYLLERGSADQKKIRFGVPDALFQALLAYVRATAEAHIKDTPLPKISDYVSAKQQSYLADAYTVDVGVWVDGVLRGSRLKNTEETPNPIGDATIRAVDDDRFKPLLERELAQAIFEITLVPDLWITVTKNELRAKTPPHNLATKCLCESRFASIYVPMIANCTTYSNAFEYYALLAKKGGVRLDRNVQFVHAPAFTAVETKQSKPLLLTGSYPKHQSAHATEETVRNIADHLVANIDEDGFTQNIRRADGRPEAYLSMGRFAFLLYSLQEYQAVTSDQEILAAIAKLRSFLLQLNENRFSGQPLRDIVKIYFNQAEQRNGGEQFMKLSDSIHTTWSQENFLFQTQYLKYRLQETGLGREEHGRLADSVTKLFQQWQQLKDTHSPVLFADMIQLLDWLDMDQELITFADWLRSQQAADGSFPRVPVEYTRGVGKLGESAASCRSTHDIANKTLIFLRQMQYTDESLYHIPTPLHRYFKYGFRHDAWNRDLWLDGSAHALLAELRLVYFSAYEAHQQKYLHMYAAASPRAD